VSASDTSSWYQLDTILLKKFQGKYWGDPDIDGRIILRGIFRKWDVGVVGTGWSWLRIGTGGGYL
jgi:hypothetical protein